MRFPEWLYRLLPGDAGTQQLGLIWRDGRTTGIATPLSVTPYRVPNDKCLVLTNAVMRTAGLALATIARRRLFADPPDGDTRYEIYQNETNVAANAIVSDNWQGEVVIPGGWGVKFEADFGTPDATDFVELEVFGYLIPRGTFVFG